MEKSIKLFVATVFFTVSVFAGVNNLTKDHPKYEQVETNLINGAQSYNTGLKASSIYMLGEMQSESSVNLLTDVLRTNNDERLRLMAALSLIKIGSERSVYVVKQIPKYEENERVARMCDKFYKAFKFNQENKDNVDAQIRYASLL